MPTTMMPGERSIALVRQHWSVVAGHVLAAAVVIVVAIVLNAVLPAKVGSLSITTVKTVVAIVFIVAAVLWAGLRILRWRFATYHLTDKRIVMEGGILSRTAETIPLDRIQNTVIHRPIGDRLIGAGDIEIESAGRDGVEVLHRIPKAEQFYNELLTAMNAPPQTGAPARPPGGI
ncbi:MAG TPA: PH domain-containing protein [Candidatus Saccharimonadales bacterium]|nr:PH domain-containing protein [Candidatus Saccharimonadales bacterium]